MGYASIGNLLKLGKTATKFSTSLTALKAVKPKPTTFTATKIKEINDVFYRKDIFAKTLKPQPLTLKKYAQKPGIIKVNSVPTQEYLDKMLGVATTERASQVTRDGVGWVNKRAVTDAHYAFTKGTPIEQVKTESIPIKQVIENMFDFKTADEYLKAEVLGTKLPENIMARRQDCFEAFVRNPYKDAPSEQASMLHKKLKDIFC